MAEEKKEIIIDVKISEEDIYARLDEITKSLAKLNMNNEEASKQNKKLIDENKELLKTIEDYTAKTNEYNNTLRQGGKLTDEEIKNKKLLHANILGLNEQIQYNNLEIKDNVANQKLISSEMKSLQGQYKLLTSAGLSYGTSLVEQKAALKELQESYSHLNKEQRESSAGKEMQNSIKELNKEIEEINQSMSGQEKTTRSLRAELINLTKEMVALSNQGFKDSERYKELQQQAGKIEKDIILIQAEIKGLASTSPMLDGLIGSAQALVGAFGAYKSTMVLLGIENQNFEKTMKQMQGILTLLVSLNTLHTTIIKNYNVQLLAKNILENIGINRTIAATRAEAAKTVMMTSGSIATKAAAAATWLLNAALSANPVVLVLTAIAALVLGIAALTKETKNAEIAQQKYNDELDKQRRVFDETKRVDNERIHGFERTLENLKNQNASIDKIREAEKNLLQERLNAATKRKEDLKASDESIEKTRKEIENNTELLAKIKLLKTEGKKKVPFTIDGKIYKDVDKAISYVESKIDCFNKKLSLEVEAVYDEKAAKEAQEDFNNKDKEAQRQRAINTRKITLDAARKLQDELIILQKKGIELEIANEKKKTKREIEDLKTRLKNDRELTKEAKKSILQTIEVLQKNSDKKIADMRRIDAEKYIKEKVSAEQTRLGLLLQASKKNSEEEYNLRLQVIEKNKNEELRLYALNLTERLKLVEEGSKEEAKIYEQSVIDLNNIKLKYDIQTNEETKKHKINTENEITKKIKNEYDKRIIDAFENAQAVSDIELNAALEEAKRLEKMDKETKEALGLSDADYTALVIANRKRIIDAEKAVMEAQINTIKSVGAVINSVADSIASVMSTMAEDSEAYAAFQKMLAIAKVAQAVAAAIALAVEASAQGDPYTVAVRIAAAAAAAIGATATLISSVKEITIPKAPKFAGGGIVGGTSYTGDKVPAMLNSREMILNMQQQSKLFDWVSSGNVGGSGIDYDLLAEKISKANESLPPPIMDYREFTDFQRRLQIIEQKTRI